MPAADEIGLGLRLVRLLDEAGDAPAAGETGQILALLDVAVAGLRAVRRHAEGHEPAVRCRRDGGLDGFQEAFGLGDQVIGGQDQQQLGRILDRGQGRGRDRRRRVAPDRLQDQGGSRAAGGAQLLGGQKSLGLVANHDRRSETYRIADPLQGLAEQAGLAQQLGEGLAGGRSRDRPEPAADSATKDDGLNAFLGHAVRGLCDGFPN